MAEKKMVQLKTQANDGDVNQFINGIESESKRNDCRVLLAMMERITGKKPRMWGESIVGFGEYQFKRASGHLGVWFQTGFSPRKQNLTVYIMTGFGQRQNLMSRLGKYKTGQGCLYFKRLEDLDQKVLEQLIAESLEKFARGD